MARVAIIVLVLLFFIEHAVSSLAAPAGNLRVNDETEGSFRLGQTNDASAIS